MKLSFKKILILSFLISAVLPIGLSCVSKSKSDSANTTTEQESHIPAGFIAGIVTAVTFGKDGYTATISDVNKNEYDVTISRANLNDATTYREVKVGDKIEVLGDRWQMDNREKITVRELR